MFIRYLFDAPALWAMWVGVVVVSVVLHELGHALAATWQGDPTPRLSGHFTWNPVVHMGWFSLGLLAFVGVAFGNTPVTAAYFRNRRWGETLVSLAGPAVNLLLATIGAATLALLDRFGGDGLPWIEAFWELMTFLNAALFLLNLIPLPPLDGFGALEGAFDLGQIGPTLRALYPLPLIVAIVVANTDGFQVFVRGLAGGLERLCAAAFGG